MGILDTLQQYKQQLGNYNQQQPQQQSWNGLGYNVPTTNISTAAPDWMQGAFAAPWWGKAAPNTGLAILQQSDPDAYARLTQPQQKQGPSEEELAYQRWLQQQQQMQQQSFGLNQSVPAYYGYSQG